jgi:hypothetical protein
MGISVSFWLSAVTIYPFSVLENQSSKFTSSNINVEHVPSLQWDYHKGRTVGDLAWVKFWVAELYWWTCITPLNVSTQQFSLSQFHIYWTLWLIVLIHCRLCFWYTEVQVSECDACAINFMGRSSIVFLRLKFGVVKLETNSVTKYKVTTWNTLWQK